MMTLPLSFLFLIGAAILLSVGIGFFLSYIFLRPRSSAHPPSPVPVVQDTAGLLAHSLDQTLTPSLHMLHARLDRIQTWLGEIQNTSRGIDDVKNLLSHTKKRGISGEISLHALLNDLFPREQLSFQTKLIPDEAFFVDAAVRILRDKGQNVWLPIDAKFPHISETSPQTRHKQLASTLRQNAKSIAQKYIRPPVTLDFAILYLPSETLFIEAMSIDGLAQQLFLDHKVHMAGPGTLSALIATILLGIQASSLSQNTHHIAHLLKNSHTETMAIATLLQQSETRLSQLSDTLNKAIRKNNALCQSLSQGIQEIGQHTP